MKRFGCERHDKTDKPDKPDNLNLLKKLEELKEHNCFLASKLEEKEVHDTLKNFTGSINEKKLLAQIVMLEGINKALEERVDYLEKDSELLLQNSTVYHTQNRMYEEELRRLRDELDKLEFEHDKLKLNIEGRNKIEEKLTETLTKQDDMERLKILSEIESKEKEIEKLESERKVPMSLATESNVLPENNPILERSKFKKETEVGTSYACRIFLKTSESPPLSG